MATERCGTNDRESLVLARVRLTFGKQPDFVLWRNSTGYDERGFRYGLCVGSADLIGVFRGLFVAVEVKTLTGRVAPEQLRFLELVWKMGGVSCVTRSEEEAHEQIRRIRDGERRHGW